MVDKKAVAQLLEIATMLQDRDLAKLAEHQSELNRARQTRALFVKAAEAENAAFQQNVDYRRELEDPRFVWRERKLYALSHFEARSAALVEAQRKVAVKSFGRAQVLQKMRSRLLR